MDNSELFTTSPFSGEFESAPASQEFEILEVELEGEFGRRGAASRARAPVRRLAPARPVRPSRLPPRSRPRPVAAWPPYGGYAFPVVVDNATGSGSPASDPLNCVRDCLSRAPSAALQPEPTPAGSDAAPEPSAAGADEPPDAPDASADAPSSSEFEFAPEFGEWGGEYEGEQALETSAEFEAMPFRFPLSPHAENTAHTPRCACHRCRAARGDGFGTEAKGEAEGEFGPAFEATFAEFETSEVLGEAEAMELVEELFAMENEEDLDLFLGKLVRSVGKAASGAVRSIERVARSIPLNKIGDIAFKAMRGDIAGILLPLLPASMQKTVRALTTDPFARFALQTTSAALRGDNILRAAQVAAKAGIDDVRERMRFAAMVAPFVPGIGSGVAAALGAASALAAGEPISQALISAARSAVPGGAIAQAAFDLGANIARGKSLAEAALAVARNQLPGGPAAKAAFDAAVALAQGKKIQDAAFAAAGGVLPKSPFAASALSFAQRVAAGEDIRKAALSTAGNAVLQRLERQGVNVLGAAQRRVAGRGLPRFGAREAEATFEGAEERFEILPPSSEAQFESGRERTGGPSRTTVLPTLTIRVRPFVVLDHFGFRKDSVPALHKPIVERIARLVIASRVSGDPIVDIRLVGHTDSTGPASFNLGLGMQRAERVKKAIEDAIADIAARMPVPPGSLNIAVQTLGETKPAASNTTDAGRALNRRVAVFLETTCNAFFAQYDLRTLPRNKLLGIPAHPNLRQKKLRSDDVDAIAAELFKRVGRRAAAALAGNVLPLQPLPPGVLRDRAVRLSKAQLDLYREYFDDGRGGIAFGTFQACFERFANGELRSPLAEDQARGVGEPDSIAFFLFAEFALLCIASHIEPGLWTQALRTFVKTQEIFMHVYRPAPHPPAPAVGAPLPSCPRAPQQGLPRALSSFSHRNFTRTGPSPTVGRGQSSPARKRALAAKYAGANLATLQRRAQENLLRVQCMP